ncbi:MAG: T9SS type A sorting domain-containing protein [Prevotellaceae bacterium]|jgi:hypothetical protein|nr:T9SS type A sorting domain-containing protein [Prevotellaceae bacterium]
MKKFSTFLIFFLCIIFNVNAQTQSIYIDFGQAAGVTASPDANSNYWNNATDGQVTAATLNLVNSQNAATDYSMRVERKFTVNNAGGLVSPSADLLNDFAVATATTDYFFVEGSAGVASALTFKNLNPGHAYKFKIFGSRSDAGERTARFSFFGLTASTGTLQTSGADLGGAGINQNNSEIFVSQNIYPDHNGNIMLEVSREAGSYAHLNIMKIEEYADVAEPEYTFSQKLYFDFGNNAGQETTGADANGNYWNNINAKNTTFSLVNSANAATGFSISIDNNITINTTSPGGLAEANINENLGDLGIATAVIDYAFVETATPSTTTISGLNTAKAYKFYLFGSRDNTSVRIVQFDIAGYNTVTCLHQNSGQNISGTGINQNNSGITVSDLIRPDVNGEILLTLSRHTSNFGHLNAMRIDEYNAPAAQQPENISVSGADITVCGANSQMSANIYPAGALCQLVWSVDNEAVAWIETNGVLYPKTNGSVLVTATANYDGGSIFATKTINISGQITELYLAGTASESISPIAMHRHADSQGTSTGIFEIFTQLNPAGEFKFYTNSEIATAQMFGGTANILSEDGAAISSAETLPVRITANISAGTYTITPINSMAVVGSCTEGNWTLSSGLTLDYQGNSVWQKTLMFDAGTLSDPPRFNFIFNQSWDNKIVRVAGTENSVLSTAEYSAYNIAIEDIPTNRNGGEFIVTLDLRNYDYQIECTDYSDKKITVIGSSVPNGQGATDMFGYAKMYAQLLENRFDESLSANDFVVSNVCVNGNNTTDVTKRWAADIDNDCGKYAFIALSLGNEGIHENGLPSFNSYRDNLQALIQRARDAGKIPVVSNSYTRTDFTPMDYNYIKQMNLLMHEWNVPSINLLGAIDNGAGQWTSDFWNGSDIYHPNDAGHTELFYACVPSLFDALENDKPQPTKKSGTQYVFVSSDKEALKFMPENILHSFTLSFDVKTADFGIIATFTTASATGFLEINANGKLVYTSPSSSTITSAAAINDDNWQKITLTHYYARGYTALYVNGTKVGELAEQLVPTAFFLNDTTVNAPATSACRDLLFYRAGMNSEEIAALNEEKMLKSSLEIYAPLDEAQTFGAPLTNYAQSENVVEKIASTPTSLSENREKEIVIFVDNSELKILNYQFLGNENVQIFDIIGKMYAPAINNSSIAIRNFNSGVYFLKIDDFVGKFVKR